MRLIGIGPVAVFGASNFPLAFSVAGGDTASAFAAGCPVVLKAHPAHPGTSELVARAVVKAVEQCGLPAGVFALLTGIGNDIGQALVALPAIQAVGFTGSHAGGQALMAVAAARPQPVPVYAEMSSINPVLLMPHALEARGEETAKGFATSLTLGEVSTAMVHGGPFPATADGRSTSVGTGAINRFLRPVCYQDLPQSLLPAALRDDNPLEIWRRRDGALTKE